MDQCISVNKKMDLVKDQARQPMWTEVFMMVNGKMTKSMETVNTNI